MSEAKAGNKWNSEAHEALLLCVIDLLHPSKAQMEEIAEKMQSNGFSFTYESIRYIIVPLFIPPSHTLASLNTFSINVFRELKTNITNNTSRQHLQKLKRARTDGTSAAPSREATPKKATPRKRAAPGSGKKSKVVPFEEAEDDDDEADIKLKLKKEFSDCEETPTKKAKRGPAVKKEDE